MFMHVRHLPIENSGTYEAKEEWNDLEFLTLGPQYNNKIKKRNFPTSYFN